MDTVKVFAPGSIGNVGCGFDVFGLAVAAVGDTVEVCRNNSAKLYITEITGDASLSDDPKKNIVTVAAQALLNKLNISQGFDFKINKGVMAGSGLGSSGCSATAGAFAMNELLGRPFNRYELINFAAEGELLASPKIHYDNVAASMLGQLTVIRSAEPLEVLKVQVPENLYLALVRPGIVINTAEAKKILIGQIEIASAIKQFGNIAGLIQGMHTSDIGLIGRSVKDEYATPVRFKLIPNFVQAKSAALTAGALGFNISGSGPAMFAVCDGQAEAEKVISALKAVYKDDAKAEFYLTKPDKLGTRRIS